MSQIEYVDSSYVDRAPGDFDREDLERLAVAEALLDALEYTERSPEVQRKNRFINRWFRLQQHRG